MFATERIVTSMEEAWTTTLEALLERGVDVPGHEPTRELLGFDVVVEDVCQRLIRNAARPLPLVSAVARFVWTMAGNDRLEDIAFYEPMVKRYSDDGLAVPGSNYGSRLRRSYAGTDQVRGAVERLRELADKPDGALRRAANVVWRPEDAARESADIPCAFGLFYLPRDGRLVTQLIMRSNNAVALLPFNMFEFSLLAEAVATEAGLQPGPFRVEASSMHMYTRRDSSRVADILRPENRSPGMSMPPMPADPGPLQQIGLLAQREAQVRHEQATVMASGAADLRARGDGLHPYWQALFDVLLVHAAEKAGNRDAASALAADIAPYFRAGVQEHLTKQRAA